MVSPWHPGHPSVGMPPVYSPRNLAAPTATSLLTALTSSAAPQTGQRERYASGGGPKGSSRATGGSGAWRLRRLLPPLKGRALSMDEALSRMPETPHAHLSLAGRTAHGVSPAALRIAWAGGEGGHDLARPWAEALDLGQRFLPPALQLGNGFGRLPPVIASPWEAFGQPMRHHTPDNRGACPRVPLDLFALGGPIRSRHPGSIVAVDASARAGRTHHLCGPGGHQALGAGGDITGLPVRHQPLALARVTGIDSPLDLWRLHGLPPPRQQRPRPRLAEQGIRDGVQMPPRSRLLIPSATGGDEVPRRVVLAMAVMGLDDDEGTAL